MTHQLFGPLVDLVGDGGFRAWTIGTTLLVKDANVVVYAIIALLFVTGMFVNIPESGQDAS